MYTNEQVGFAYELIMDKWNSTVAMYVLFSSNLLCMFRQLAITLALAFDPIIVLVTYKLAVLYNREIIERGTEAY